ncbi:MULTISPECIES: carboxypeptidase-like regulatory domain-containing protein [Odoribacteraceae]|uniref:carboxypeptidase-like regulatory domain-containing protein n=1 Tax=Odoribacteraceae TaxID=1853231 RepID=UPI000E472664|nr:MULTISPECIES: carboxypeptidase-like regulatory domain-containing protein [Odoribacteraceae]MCQ4874629.1 carboxypeptidase-like regulatory domain-containing protein [Butyricimonas paravirosa]RHR83139.1 carboxypeptidase regulatory-like domain-containing protein [Odoribacter sp. AF15-53]
MKVKSLVVLAAVVVIAVITCSFTMKSDVKWITVSGYVDNTSGDVISQVDVTCTLNSDHTLLNRTQTNAEGYYSIQVKQSESCTLTFSHVSYVPQDEIVTSDTDIDDMNVTLRSQEE